MIQGFTEIEKSVIVEYVSEMKDSLTSTSEIVWVFHVVETLRSCEIITDYAYISLLDTMKENFRTPFPRKGTRTYF